jgi:hypothetical protein
LCRLTAIRITLFGRVPHRQATDRRDGDVIRPMWVMRRASGSAYREQRRSGTETVAATRSGREAAVGLEVSPARPIARLVVGALSGRRPERSSRRGPYVPPVVDPEEFHACAAGPASASDDVAHCEVLLQALLGGERAEDLERWLAPELVVWTPVRYTSTRADLLHDLHDLDLGGDTLTEVVIAVTNADVAAPRVHLEWRLTARFSHPCFVDDDLLVEPTGRLVETAGVMIATIDDGMITAARCYYDDFALLEQLVSAV